MRPLTCYEWKSSKIKANQQDYHFKFITNHLLAINGLVAGFTYQIHIRPLTFYDGKVVEEMP